MSLIEVEVEGPIARVALNRPDQRNALSIPMLEELTRVFGDLAVDPAARVVVLWGRGPDFCAGADFAELEQVRALAQPLDFDAPFREALAAIAVHPVPVVARVHGRALGGGCQIVLACDLAVAARDCQLGIPSSRLGIVIPLASVERLVLAVGPKRAADVLLAGRVLDAGEAEAWGLVTRTVPPEDLDDATEELLGTIAENAPLSVRASKRGIGLALDRRSGAAMGGEHRTTDFDMMAAEALASDDLAEGIQAFRERRKPEFRGA